MVSMVRGWAVGMRRRRADAITNGTAGAHVRAAHEKRGWTITATA